MLMKKITDARPKIALFAYSQPGYACLEELIANKANVSAVFTHIDAEDEGIWFDSVFELAKKNNIKVYRSKKVDEEALKIFAASEADIIISAYYRAIIPDEILNAAKLGAYNLHGSLLPKYRGRACINWAVLNGEKQTGVTMHIMTAKADKGDIIAQEAFPIETEDTGHTVFLKVSQAVRIIIKKYLPLLENGTAKHSIQDESQATKFGRRRPADGIIDWTKDANAIYNLIRSVTHPFPGAFTFFAKQKLFIWWAKPILDSALREKIDYTKYKPGDIIKLDDKVIIKCGSNCLLLKKIAWEQQPDKLPNDAIFKSTFKTGAHLGEVLIESE